ncbi:DUF1611 domain-containing protein [Jeotgalibacillus sp. ET6]|uniref:DUF1611 domain-containing protein n=1 Tax=Jeotgalibacillus sp. ET6 TaxID=3037260 RepID=UPI002418976F|nr:DUF1611 domain-containing protein [Jeotgalibacillus sp. ET6]MDG5473221.1 DUF1611 domain-containing protein [Jeotgalibacillus sp. ET6]
MKNTALIYCERNFGKMDGKTANGLIRQSGKYDITGVIDSTQAGLDAGEVLDEGKNGIPVFASLEQAIERLEQMPTDFIYGIAPAEAFLKSEERELLFQAMKQGMNIINPLHEFLGEDEEFKQYAEKYSVTIVDVRKPPLKKDLHLFSGQILSIETPIVAVLGTDSAVGKRTTAVLLQAALEKAGFSAAFIATGQTGLLQGAAYGAAVDALPSQYITGEIENQIMKAYNKEHPDIIIVEGQGALSHPAYISSSGILKGARPGAVIVQHPPMRVNLGDFPFMKMPTVKSEIELIENFSHSKVVAITINHENMTDHQIDQTVKKYEEELGLPATDVLKHGCDKLVQSILTAFPSLAHKKTLVR